jgi:hypothetical protein
MHVWSWKRIRKKINYVASSHNKTYRMNTSIIKH